MAIDAPVAVAVLAWSAGTPRPNVSFGDMICNIWSLPRFESRGEKLLVLMCYVSQRKKAGRDKQSSVQTIAYKASTPEK